MADKQSGPHSLVRVLRILELLTEAKEGLPLASLTKLLQAPRSSIYALVRPLVSLGYLRYADKTYKIGARSMTLAKAIVRSVSTEQVIDGIMDELSESLGLTVCYSEYLPAESLLVHRRVLQGRRPIRYVANAGDRRPLPSTAVGRAILAFHDAFEVAKCLRKLERDTGVKLSKKEIAGYEAMLERIRRDGLATSFGGYDKSVGGIAIPMFLGEEKPMAALSISGPLADIKSERKAISLKLLEVARQLSHYKGNTGSDSRTHRQAGRRASV